MNISSRHNIVSLKKKEEIDHVFRKGKKYHTRYGPVFMYKSSDRDHCTRVAILLKKSVGSAVQRNYIKRIIRNFVARNFQIIKGSNRLIFLYNSREPVSYARLEKEYLQVLIR